MKEFIEKLIGRLEKLRDRYQDKYGFCSDSVDYGKTIGLNDAISIVNQLAEEYRNDKVCQTAIMYAKNLHKYGVQIDSIWETATQQSMALKQAYMRGRQDERDIFDEWQEKHINTSTTNADRIRSMTDEELAEFLNCIHEQDEDTILIPNGNKYESYHSVDEILDWLQSKVEGVTENE